MKKKIHERLAQQLYMEKKPNKNVKKEPSGNLMKMKSKIKKKRQKRNKTKKKQEEKQTRTKKT